MPIQTNGYDCGLFVLEFCYLLASSLLLNFSNEDIDRTKIAAQIMCGADKKGSDTASKLSRADCIYSAGMGNFDTLVH